MLDFWSATWSAVFGAIGGALISFLLIEGRAQIGRWRARPVWVLTRISAEKVNLTYNGRRPAWHVRAWVDSQPAFDLDFVKGTTHPVYGAGDVSVLIQWISGDASHSAQILVSEITHEIRPSAVTTSPAA